MSNTLSRRAALGTLAASGLALAGCGGGNGSARLRLVNASPGYASLDLYADDRLKVSAVGFLVTGDYASVEADSSIDVALKAAGASTTLSTESHNFDFDSAHTLVAYGWQGALKTALIDDDVSEPASSKTTLTVMNLATDAGALDVYLSAVGESFDLATPIASALAGGAKSNALSAGAGDWRLRITAAGDKRDLRFDSGTLTLPGGKVATLLITPGSSGVLVHAALLLQRGGASALANTQARLRVVAAVGGNGRVSASAGNTDLITQALSPAIGGWHLVNAGSAIALNLSVDGNALSVPARLAAGADHTLLVWGSAGAPQFSLVAEDNRLPLASGDAKLRLVHAVSDLAAPLTLTANYNALASALPQGSVSAYTALAASTTALLEVNSPLTVTPLVSLADTTLTAQGLYSLYVFGTQAAPQPVLRKER